MARARARPPFGWSPGSRRPARGGPCSPGLRQRRVEPFAATLQPGTYALVARWSGSRPLPVEPTAFLDAEVTDTAIVVGTGCAGGDHRFRRGAAELEAVPPSDRVYLPAGCSMAVVHQWSWIATVLAGPLRVEVLPDGFLLRGADHAMRYGTRGDAPTPR